MNIIVKTLFGSHLYGTNTPESDQDFKGVFLPSKEQILLGRIPKSISEKTKQDNSIKNTSEDIDFEMYSLHYFIHLACEGETVALDMLHAPEEMIIEKSPIWDSIVKNRFRFYTKNLKAFVGYARRQAAKYGIKGSRLNDAQRVLDFLNTSLEVDYAAGAMRMRTIWENLPTGEYIFKHPPNENGMRYYEVCGRKLGESELITNAHVIVGGFVKSYGERARMAAANEGIDWKAVSHALRAAMQVKQILTEKTLTLPFKESEATFLRMVKQGKLDYQKTVAPELEHLMEEVEALSLKSDLPENVDRKFWDKFIIKTLESEQFTDTDPTKTYLKVLDDLMFRI
jgi:hypothetical protein